MRDGLRWLVGRGKKISDQVILVTKCNEKLDFINLPKCDSSLADRLIVHRQLIHPVLVGSGLAIDLGGADVGVAQAGLNFA